MVNNKHDVKCKVSDSQISIINLLFYTLHIWMNYKCKFPIIHGEQQTWCKMQGVRLSDIYNKICYSTLYTYEWITSANPLPSLYSIHATDYMAINIVLVHTQGFYKVIGYLMQKSTTLEIKTE